MGVDFTPYAIIGVKLATEEVYKKEHKSVGTNERCKCTPKTQSRDVYCSGCGAQLYRKESVYTIYFPDLSEEDLWEIAYDGWRDLDVVVDNYMTEGENYFFGYAVGGGDIHYGGEEFKEIPNISALKEKLKNELQPLGLWHEERFGLYCVVSVS
jgi:hypothetical protein